MMLRTVFIHLVCMVNFNILRNKEDKNSFVIHNV